MKRTKGLTWTTADGRVIPIVDLGDKHLVNILCVIEESLSLFKPACEAAHVAENKATLPDVANAFLNDRRLPDGGMVTQMETHEHYTEYTVRYPAPSRYMQAFISPRSYSLAPVLYDTKKRIGTAPLKKNISADRLMLYGPLVIEAIRRGLFTWKQDRKYLSGIALKIADKISDGD